MTTVVLLRHGRTAANATGVLAGRSRGVGLDDTGRQQAKQAAERLAGVKLAAVITSPLQRTRQTAAALLDGHPDRTLHVERGLVECGYGTWTGRKLSELAKEPLWKVVQTRPSAVRFPDGESMLEMAARAWSTICDWDQRLTAEHGADAVWVAVSHADVIKAILAESLGMHLDAFQRILVNPASISVVRVTSDRPYVLTTNSTTGDLTGLLTPPPRGKRKGTRRRGAHRDAHGDAHSDAPVGGGLGAGDPGAGGAA